MSYTPVSVPVSFETFQPRQGFLLKLGGGQEKGSKWNRRWFVLRDNVLMYFASPKDFTGFRDKPSGIVLLEECNVRTRDDRASAQRFQFVLSHPNGESVVLAAESEKEMLEWMQAVRTSRICVADAEAATQAEALRRDGAERELDGALSGGVQGDAALVSIDAELEAVQLEHRDVEIEKEKAEKELKELMARFKLRKALLHWRHRKLTLSFRTLVTVVFQERIDAATETKVAADGRLGAMSAEMGAAVAARQKAEAAKRKSEEMLTKELALKKEGEAEARDFQRLLLAEAERFEVAQGELDGAGAAPRLDTKEKEELLQMGLHLERVQAESEMLQQRIRRKAA